MRTVHHPTLPTSRQVPDADVERWRAAGWRSTAPTKKQDTEPAPEVPAAANAADQGQRPSENEGD